jgi:hypothetical protein
MSSVGEEITAETAPATTPAIALLVITLLVAKVDAEEVDIWCWYKRRKVASYDANSTAFIMLTVVIGEITPATTANSKNGDCEQTKV